MIGPAFDFAKAKVHKISPNIYWLRGQYKGDKANYKEAVEI